MRLPDPTTHFAEEGGSAGTEGRAPEVERTLFWRAHPACPNRAVRSGDWKLVLEPRPMLFNLRNDIGERDNLIAHSSARRENRASARRRRSFPRPLRQR